MIDAFMGCESVNEPPHGLPQTCNSSLGGLTQQRLGFGNGILDRQTF